MLSDTQVIDIFKALADPNRLQVFHLLLDTDLTNSELMDATGLRQNLLSHHLAILTDSLLVRAQRSIGDARRHYYAIDWQIATQFGDWWMRQSPAQTLPLPALNLPRRVLFLCLRNTSRSLVAELLARLMAPDAIIPYSAGIYEPELTPALPPVMLQVMGEKGVSPDGLEAKSVQELDPNLRFDYVVTVCDIAHEHEGDYPTFPNAIHLHWSLRDPVLGVDDPQEQLQIARELYDEIYLRLIVFVQRLGAARA